ncbi:LCP family protein [Candidatus Saccharibacteria bacterium]|nr:LCP family protein [Candidatus Saccharibacteria bacterium]
MAKTIDGFSAKPNNKLAPKKKKGVKNVGGVEFGLQRKTAKPVRVKISDKPIAKKKTRKEASEDFLAPVGTFGLDMNLDEGDLVQKSKKNKKVKKLGKEKKKGSKKKRIIIIVILLLILGAGIFAFLYVNGFLSKVTNGNAGIFDFIMAKDVELKKDSNGRTNVLAFGTSGYNMEGDEGNGVHDGAQLTDSIMVISFDQETKDVAMVNLPRDMYVKKTCTSTGKVNEVYWCADPKGDNEAAGADALAKAVQEIFGIEIQYYVHVNWGSLVQVVDSVGGITLTLDETIQDSWTKTYIKAGETVTLNGEQALGLARARHGTAGGDFTRGASQQKILMALQEKLLQGGIDISEALGLMNALGDNLRMDFNADEIKTLSHIAGDVSLDSMRQIPLTNVDGKNYVTTQTINGISYVVPVGGAGNYTELHKYIAKMLSTDLAVREDAKILVLNGSGVSGVAATEQKALESAGFNVGGIGDAPSGTYPDKYYLYDVTGTMNGTKASLEKRYDTAAQSAENIPQGINSKGYDFVVIIGKQGE